MLKDYFFNEEHQMFRESVRRFVNKEIKPQIDKWEEQEFPDKTIFKRMGDLGLLGLQYPQEYGGQGADIRTSLVFWEELSRCGALGFVVSVLNHTDMGSACLNKGGSHKLKDKYLRGICTGEKLLAIAMTEPDYGSDVASIKTRAVLEGDNYRVNGTKMFVTNATQADFIVTVVRTGGAGYKGISLLLIDTDTPGFSVSRKLKKMGALSSDTAEVVFEDCLVPKENLLGEENQGFYALMKGIEMERMCIGAMTSTAAALSMEEAIRYAQQRTQFDRPIISFQAINHMIAEMATDVEAGKSLLYHTASMYDAGFKCNKECSMTKLFCTEMFLRVVNKALQIHGGYGYMKEFLVERLYRDAKLFTLGGGTSQILKDVILAEMDLIE